MIDGLNQVNNPKHKPCFVKQRRVMDAWGRMMLMKPNRKQLEYEAWQYWDYYVYDYLSKTFAVSLLNDEDFHDLRREAPRSFSVYLQRVRCDQLQRMDSNRLLQRVLSNKVPLKKQLTVQNTLVDKQARKVQRIAESTKAKQFHAQQIRVEGTLFGTILVATQNFIFISAC